MATFDRYNYEASSETWTKIGIVKLEQADIASLSYQRMGFTKDGTLFPVCDIRTTGSIELSVGGDLETVVAALTE